MSKAGSAAAHVEDGVLNRSDLRTFQTDSKDFIPALLPRLPV
jgi:hypothetical protein